MGLNDFARIIIMKSHLLNVFNDNNIYWTLKINTLKVLKIDQPIQSPPNLLTFHAPVVKTQMWCIFVVNENQAQCLIDKAKDD